ncbi:hypothetical protein J0S82_009126, partial [Galemys pyrenaicus]
MAIFSSIFALWPMAQKNGRHALPKALWESHCLFALSVLGCLLSLSDVAEGAIFYALLLVSILCLWLFYFFCLKKIFIDFVMGLKSMTCLDFLAKLGTSFVLLK